MFSGSELWRRFCWTSTTHCLASDAQIAVHAGYPTMLLGGIDHLKLPAHYHKPTDVPENIIMECLADAVRVLDALVRELGTQDRASSERATASAS